MTQNRNSNYNRQAQQAAPGIPMIDKLTLLFSTLMVVYVVLRAAKMNRTLPWFETKSVDALPAAHHAAASGPVAGPGVGSRRSGPPAARHVR